ncbi:hypothetical protein BY996DRAFT_6434514 [Phakopsora pachyrhizi]|uniref:Pre-mRNA-splicing factor CWC24 n=1 Tax=Phakopsora pachyrhizi TaxID=170000 RepID=A0AAV0AIQ0_PHAPC|nr:hypothetical protein BY996DRAFT_6434514 [Phakopsora pachyrhizi]CAH7667590.1 hypothetical protein PPACK8108_LOCUS1997 [Phakopsora pachyrhizi]
MSLNETNQETLTDTLFKKKKKKINNNSNRKRTTESSDHQTDDGPSRSSTKSSTIDSQTPVVKFSKRKSQSNPLYQTTGRVSKKLREQASESEDEDEDDGGEEDLDSKIARRGGVSYQAQGSARQQASEMIEALLDKKKKREPNPDEIETFDEKDGLYHGKSATKHQLPKGSAKYGPIKGGPDNIRTITVLDYQPDVCKDYKETGYCGFGDTCKFLHDRSDYMHGWQLDDAFNSTLNKKLGVESEEEEEVPFACLICREAFKDPVVTKCNHYFCSSCAIKRFAKTPKCFACGAPTSGIFNKATKIIERMRLKQERIRKEKESRRIEEEGGLSNIEGLGSPKEGKGEVEDDDLGSERSFYEDE